MCGATYKLDEVARSTCSSRAELEDANQPAMAPGWAVGRGEQRTGRGVRGALWASSGVDSDWGALGRDVGWHVDEGRYGSVVFKVSPGAAAAPPPPECGVIAPTCSPQPCPTAFCLPPPAQASRCLAPKTGHYIERTTRVAAGRCALKRRAARASDRAGSGVRMNQGLRLVTAVALASSSEA